MPLPSDPQAVDGRDASYIGRRRDEIKPYLT